VASLSQGRTAAAQCGLFTHKSVPVIFEPPCINCLLIKSGMKHDELNFKILKHELYIFLVPLRTHYALRSTHTDSMMVFGK